MLVLNQGPTVWLARCGSASRRRQRLDSGTAGTANRRERR